jgi:hypothetical protein
MVTSISEEFAEEERGSKFLRNAVNHTKDYKVAVKLSLFRS